MRFLGSAARAFGTVAAFTALNILFVSHAANRSGAPLVLLELLRYLKRETAHHATILCLRDGPLRDEFARVATVLEPSAPFVRASQIAAARRRLNEELGPVARLDGAAWALERLNGRQSRARARELAAAFDLIYLNSLASGDVLPALEPILARAPLVTHVHELEWAIESLGSVWNGVKKRSSAFVATSEAVKTHLVEARGVAREKVETVHAFLDFGALQTDQSAARIELRARLRLPSDSFLVGGCGTMEWRKGADWWALLAARCAPETHFVWLGGQKNLFSRQVAFDLKKLGIEKRVHFLPPTHRTAPFFAGLDAFALTSREEPLGIVALEAAAQGVPVVCFERAGGAVELVGDDAGFIALYGDFAAMARALELWRADESLRHRLGQTAARKARAMSDVRVGAPKIAALMERTVSGAMRAPQPRGRQGV